MCLHRVEKNGHHWRGDAGAAPESILKIRRLYGFLVRVYTSTKPDSLQKILKCSVMRDQSAQCSQLLAQAKRIWSRFVHSSRPWLRHVTVATQSDFYDPTPGLGKFCWKTKHCPALLEINFTYSPRFRGHKFTFSLLLSPSFGLWENIV